MGMSLLRLAYRATVRQVTYAEDAGHPLSGAVHVTKNECFVLKVT